MVDWSFRWARLHPAPINALHSCTYLVHNMVLFVCVSTVTAVVERTVMSEYTPSIKPTLTLNLKVRTIYYIT